MFKLRLYVTLAISFDSMSYFSISVCFILTSVIPSLHKKYFFILNSRHAAWICPGPVKLLSFIGVLPIKTQSPACWQRRRERDRGCGAVCVLGGWVGGIEWYLRADGSCLLVTYGYFSERDIYKQRQSLV